MKVAIAYLTKNRAHLTEQTFPALRGSAPQFDILWFDGSTDETALGLLETLGKQATWVIPDVKGGADAAIVRALTTMLRNPEYTHVGLCENDVLLAPDWFARTMALFTKAGNDGLEVGAASARAYADRILIQRDGYAVMHNLGAGHVIFTCQAARLILENYRTGWWPDNRVLFAQVSGIDIGGYACFRGNSQWITADWHFDCILASRGLASVALTPCAADMIGQDPPLEEQGLVLVDKEVDERRSNVAMLEYMVRTRQIRAGDLKLQAITRIHRATGNAGASLIFPHQLDDWEAEGDWRLKWAQGFGPFAWRAGADDCKAFVRVFGPSIFIVSGDERGGKLKLIDRASGYEVEPDLPSIEHGLVQLAVPGHCAWQEVELQCGAGVTFYGVQTQEPQPASTMSFDYSILPPV